jgi:hypothetical protein
VKPLLTLVSSPKENSTSTQHSEPFCLTLGSYTGVRKGSSSAPQTKTPQEKKSSDEEVTQAPGGVVKKRMEGIEEAAKGAQCMQPPSLYVSVATPLEV